MVVSVEVVDVSIAVVVVSIAVVVVSIVVVVRTGGAVAVSVDGPVEPTPVVVGGSEADGAEVVASLLDVEGESVLPPPLLPPPLPLLAVVVLAMPLAVVLGIVVALVDADPAPLVD